METFTCWWHPLDNSLQGDDNITYRLIYTLGNGPPTECPDYVSGGPNSCYFDTEHTVIWEVYCMNVTAHTSSGSFTSKEHCLDVAEIVKIDPPFNLTYTLMNMTKYEAGQTVLVSWQYPIAQHVQIGWITLIYELRYTLATEPNNWKVKERLREPHLELLGLPVGRYEVQVRCRSKNNHLWSKWSSPITIVIPSGHLPDHMLYVLILMATTVVIMLIIGLGVIPQSKRIKAFLLPPVPKPCIRGIDPMFLKKGKMDEINRHFSSLQGYKAPHYCGESVYQVSLDEGVSLSEMSSMSSIQEDQEPQGIQSPDCTEDQQLLHTPDSPNSFCPNPSYCSNKSTGATMTPENPLWAWPAKSNMQPELVSFVGTEYNMIVKPTVTSTSALPTAQEFYTCVHRVTTNEMVQLVPCMSHSHKGSPYFELNVKSEEDKKKLRQLAAYLEKRVEVQANDVGFCPGVEEQIEYVVSLLSQPTD